MAANIFADYSAEEEERQRAFRLVGEFIWNWGALEGALNRAIHKLCNLTGLQSYVVTQNMGVRDKIHTVRTMLYICHINEPAVVKANNKLMDKISDFSLDRNMVAHTSFTSDPVGVKFLVIKAKGKFDIPDVIWSAADFSTRGLEMFELSKELEAAVKTGAERRAARAGSAIRNVFLPPPSEAPNTLTGLLHLGRHAPAHPGTQSPSPTEAPETPPAPPAKPKGGKKSSEKK